MDVVIDTSALIAVIVGESERDRIVRSASGMTLIGPGSIHWEVGNAFSAMLKSKRLGLAKVREGLRIYGGIPVRFVHVDLDAALALAAEAAIYAYDAYFLECALSHKAPLLTLDGGLQRAARKLGVKLMEE